MSQVEQAVCLVQGLLDLWAQQAINFQHKTTTAMHLEMPEYHLFLDQLTTKERKRTRKKTKHFLHVDHSQLECKYKMDLGHWLLVENVAFNEETFGFIYEITNILTNKKYIGKKQCKSKLKRKPLKGRVNKRIEIRESDWREYTSSSNDLNADIIKYGKDKFVFKIIRACGSKWELAYFEIKQQLDNNVLLRDDYYNGIINVRIGRPPRKFLD